MTIDDISEPVRISAQTPSISRFNYLRNYLGSNSLTRSLQYEFLESYPIQGEVLDFGGGEKSHYRKLLKCSGYTSVNIDKDIQPTWMVDIGNPIPCDDDNFDTVISLNTLEHVFDAGLVIRELHRVLKPAGELILSTPFLFPIHGHPDDYFRPTPSWYRQTLSAIGFRVIDVIPLSWGPYSTASVCSGTPGPGKKMRIRLAMMIDLIYYNLRMRNRSSTDIHEYLERFATAFLVRAVK